MTSTPLPEARRLAVATAVALGVAVVVLVVAVLPAEYGVDVTGLGAAAGFARLSADGDATDGERVAVEDAPLFELRSAWRLLDVPLADLTGPFAKPGAEERVRWAVALANVTTVHVNVSWPASPTAETIELRLVAPSGARSQSVTATSGAGEPGNATVALNVVRTPFPTVTDDHVTIALRSDTTAVGNWTLTLVRHYGSDEAPEPLEWRAAVRAEAYEAESFAVAQKDADQVRITVDATRDLEYKFRLRENASLRFEWSSTAPVFWSLHGEREGEGHDQLVEFEAGTTSSHAGTVKAPFDGAFGWYFRNSGTERAVVTLVTTGDYEILGVP